MMLSSLSRRASDSTTTIRSTRVLLRFVPFGGMFFGDVVEEHLSFGRETLLGERAQAHRTPEHTLVVGEFDPALIALHHCSVKRNHRRLAVEHRHSSSRPEARSSTTR